MTAAAAPKRPSASSEGAEQPPVRPPGGDGDRGERRHGERRDDVVPDAERAGDDREQRPGDAAERRQLQPEAGSG